MCSWLEVGREEGEKERCPGDWLLGTKLHVTVSPCVFPEHRLLEAGAGSIALVTPCLCNRPIDFH